MATPTWAPLSACVVHAVADHGDVPALVAQGGDDPFLLLGGDAPEHRRPGDQPVEWVPDVGLDRRATALAVPRARGT
jgi:hypothetical protein